MWRCMRERNVPETYVNLIQDMYTKNDRLSNKGAQCSRRKRQLQRGCGVTPMICIEPIPIPHTLGCTDKRGEESNTRIRDVCGRHCTFWR